MKKYTITFLAIVDVEAETPAEAHDIAVDNLFDGDYLHTDCSMIEEYDEKNHTHKLIDENISDYLKNIIKK